MRLLLICICLLSVVLCARPINDGNKLFKKGDYAGALEKYMKAREAEPANPLLFYNIGTCQYKLGNYDEAKKELESAVRMPDKKMAAKAAYNLANTHFRIGEKSSEGSERIAAWRESVAYLKKAIDLDNGFENAKKNVEIVQRKLKEELDKQKQNQEQNQDQDKDKDKDENKDQQQEPQPEKQEEQEQKAEEQKPQDEKSPDQKEVEALIRKALERSEEHENDKRDRMRKAPLSPNERDW